jgi:hypothetical protein
MSGRDLETKFARIGARAKLEERPPTRWNTDAVSLDVQRDGQGEFFLIRTRSDMELRIEVVDAQPDERHLLLMVEEGRAKQKFLCGHDEREWFVAAVPEVPGVRDVETAMEALKPEEVREAQAHKKVRTRDRNRRKNEAYVRQGEWFFLPEPDLEVDEKRVLHHEPFSRGNGSKPHTAEFCYRTGGETVYVCSYHPNGLLPAEYESLIARDPNARNWYWQTRQRDPEMYVRGRISHPDHKTVVLRCWHRVRMNTENQSRAMRHVRFLD